MGDAPYTIARRLEKSVVCASGVDTSSWMSAGTRNAVVTPNSGIARRIRTGSTSRISTVRHPWDRPASAQPDPPMWNIGITARFTEPGVSSHEDRDLVDPAEEVVVGEHHALGQTRRARRVELEHDVVAARLHHRDRPRRARPASVS